MCFPFILTLPSGCLFKGIMLNLLQGFKISLNFMVLKYFIGDCLCYALCLFQVKLLMHVLADDNDFVSSTRLKNKIENNST